MSKKVDRSDKSKTSMSEESRQPSEDAETTLPRRTPLSSPSPPTTSDPSRKTSGESPLSKVFSRKSPQTPEKGTPLVSSTADPQLGSAKKLFGLISHESEEEQTSPAPPAQTSSATTPPENPPKEILPVVERFKYQSGSPTKTEPRPTESSGTQETQSSLKRVVVPSSDEPISRMPQTPEKRMRYPSSPTLVIKVIQPDATSTTPVYDPEEPTSATADKLTSPVDEFPSLAPPTSSQPPLRRPSLSRVKVATSRFLADSLSTLVDALRNVVRKPTKDSAGLTRRTDGKFVVVESKQAKTDSRMKQMVDQLLEKLYIAGCPHQQVGDKQKQSVTEPPSSTKFDSGHPPALAQASSASSRQRRDDIEIINPRFETEQMLTSESEDVSPRQRSLSQTLKLEYLDYDGETILYEVSLSFSPTRVDLAVNRLQFGAFRDARATKDKYWYFGPLRTQASFVLGFFNRDSPVKANMKYTPPCSGCSKCYLSRSGLTRKSEEVKTKRWWHPFVPSFRRNLDESNRPVVDYAKISNPLCGEENEISINTVDLNVSPEVIDNVAGLRVDIGPESISIVDFIREGWERAREKIENVERAAGHRKFYAQELHLTPLDEKMNDNFFSMDNEDFEIKKISVSLLHNVISVFQSPQKLFSLKT